MDNDWIVNTGVEPTDGYAKVEVMFASGVTDVDDVQLYTWELGPESWRIVQYRYI